MNQYQVGVAAEAYVALSIGIWTLQLIQALA